MIVASQHANAISLGLDADEVVYFRGDLLRGRSFGIPWIPPYPFGSPIARLLAGCFFMNRASRRDDQPLLQLNGDSGLGRFELIVLGPADRYFVHPRYLAAFSFSAGGGMHTQLTRLLSPSCWGIHHPLPVVVQGPGHLVVYAENLYCSESPAAASGSAAPPPMPPAVAPGRAGAWSAARAVADADAEYLPGQVVAFDCRQGFRVRALHPDDSPLSQVINALIDDNRICFQAGSRVYVSPINHPLRHKLRLFLQVLIHVALIPVILYVLSH